MFDSSHSLRAAAWRYREAASRAQDHDIGRFFVALAERCDQHASALEQQGKGTFVFAWDSFHSPHVSRTMEPHV